MIHAVDKLHTAAHKNERIILGLMSGTSLDGLDMALCSISGCGLQTKVKLLHFETVPFEQDFKQEIKNIFSKKQVDFEKLTLLHPWVALQHAANINATLNKWQIDKSDVDLIASHGQTVYHAPQSLHGQEKFGNATLQIGDGDHLAVATGITVISDFRQKNIAAGGEGAPLAVYGDYLVFGKEAEDRILLNIGGISNFTFLPGSMNSKEIFSTDTGPGNTLMDAFVQQHFPGRYFDEDATLAKQGTVNEDLLAALKKNSFFTAPFPKTTGPELFNLRLLDDAMLQSRTTTISNNDILATLNQFTADSIADAVRSTLGKEKSATVFLSGGGTHNPLLVAHLKRALPQCSFENTASLGIHPDAKEAVLFAILANECISGDGSYFAKGVKGMPAISMGKISFPQ
ncbi:MAG: anhydro-N-acetylmuramic acid kinase [Ferruginibacter sp.]